MQSDSAIKKKAVTVTTKKGEKIKNLFSEHLKKVLLSSNCLCDMV